MKIDLGLADGFAMTIIESQISEKTSRTIGPDYSSVSIFITGPSHTSLSPSLPLPAEIPKWVIPRDASLTFKSTMCSDNLNKTCALRHSTTIINYIMCACVFLTVSNSKTARNKNGKIAT